MYIVLTEQTIGGHTRAADKSWMEFENKDKLADYLRSRGNSSVKIRVFEAKEMNFEVKVELHQKIKGWE